MLGWLLLLVLFFLIVFSYTNNNHDIFNPSLLFSGGFFIATLLTMLNANEWGVELGFKTFFIILIGILGFFLGEKLAYKMSSKKVICISMNSSNGINVKFWKLSALIILDIIILFLQYREVIRISQYADSYYTNLGVMTAYKNALLHGYEITEWVEQLTKIETTSTLVFIYIFINNCFAYKKIFSHNNWAYLIPIGLDCVLIFLRGGRGGFILVFGQIAFLIYYFSKSTHQWGKVISRKFIKKAIIGLISFFVFFYYSRFLVGRVVFEDFFNYMSKYIGGSIQLLDMYLKNPITNNNIFLSESLPGLINSLRKIGILDCPPIQSSLEFRITSTGIDLGNIYTSLRRYYNDLNLFGVIIFPFTLSYIFSSMYMKFKSYGLRNRNDIFWMIVFSSNIALIPMQAMEDQFFISRISLGYFIELVLLYFCVWFLLPNKKQ